jgi:hypothetical protein
MEKLTTARNPPKVFKIVLKNYYLIMSTESKSIMKIHQLIHYVTKEPNNISNWTTHVKRKKMEAIRTRKSILDTKEINKK